MNILEIMNSGNQHNSQTAVVCIDYKAAFDSIDHDYMWAVLEYFGIGQGLIRMIRTMYKNRTGFIYNDEGKAMESFNIQSGTMQGCIL